MQSWSASIRGEHMRPDHLPTPACSGCDSTVHLVPRRRRIRRGERSLDVDGWLWECASCADPFTGERSYRFADPPLLRWGEEQAALAWERHFGEPIPPSERGRHPGPHRTTRVPVLLTPAETAHLDELRGEESRSDFLGRVLKAS